MQLYTERKCMPDAAEHRFAAAGSGLLTVLAIAAALGIYPGSADMRGVRTATRHLRDSGDPLSL